METSTKWQGLAVSRARFPKEKVCQGGLHCIQPCDFNNGVPK